MIIFKILGVMILVVLVIWILLSSLDTHVEAHHVDHEEYCPCHDCIGAIARSVRRNR